MSEKFDVAKHYEQIKKMDRAIRVAINAADTVSDAEAIGVLERIKYELLYIKSLDNPSE